MLPRATRSPDSPARSRGREAVPTRRLSARELQIAPPTEIWPFWGPQSPAPPSLFHLERAIWRCREGSDKSGFKSDMRWVPENLIAVSSSSRCPLHNLVTLIPRLEIHPEELVEYLAHEVLPVAENPGPRQECFSTSALSFASRRPEAVRLADRPRRRASSPMKPPSCSSRPDSGSFGRPRRFL